MSWWLCSIALIHVFSHSYIHPDEHFQSLEIISHLLQSTTGFTPWEFNSYPPSRSMIPLYMLYVPLFKISNLLSISNPFFILYSIRFILILSYLIILNYCLPVLLPDKAKSRIAKWLVLTSYVTWSFQCHTFSNSVETCLLLLVLSIYSRILQNNSGKNYTNSIIVGFFITISIFNRITFPAFILFPSLTLLRKFYINNWLPLLSLLSSITVTSIILICIDTQVFQSNELVIAPWNNLIYNLNVDNLALHGLHPRYTHMLINLPQLLGPLIIPFVFVILSSLTLILTDINVGSLTSGLLFLSILKHQELRFLVPLFPIACIAVTESRPKLLQVKWFKYLWIAFNLVLLVILGWFHQSGVLNVINYLYKNNETTNFGVNIWWKTYTPPTWMYSSTELIYSTVTMENGIEILETDYQRTTNHVIDLKGSDVSLLNSTISSFLQNIGTVQIICPNSMKNTLLSLNSESQIYQYDQIYNDFTHLDLDHFNSQDLNSYLPGIHIYNVSYSHRDQ
ncbi:hypothetical protein Kpol_495p6 [Vanderwaltozyma polyspora DSM 70294]|uniref:Mannosyltransferase n=1 Tax=Vanderwaltozyma polyspora (strain ATCC 22028 / DSM 70294 / BCRC 21397 / CBS 2163 / NBRC 10782 / NRRL Y-8283 / UCD 57-17) TaxID=436907 RepID=A7TNY3_VANPO|nr:uncharacterized protein Kpol_495p6 [Vanderwaltozyma polyspora DSM 70294]EDO16008.1 hypothetical protein Kpol_495p6 [Vanderwaltozyma polyspora DSM 70294]